MSARLAAILCCLMLCLSVTLPAAEDDAAPAPPAGVSVTVLPDAPGETPQTEAEEALDRAKAKPDDPLIGLSYDGVPFGEVLADLSERLGVNIVCTDEKLMQRKCYRHVRVSRSRALPAACGTMLAAPLAGYIVCTQDEVVAGDMAPTLKVNPRLDIALQDANLPEALQYLWKTTGVPMAATESFAQSKATYSSKDKTLSETMDGIAAALEAKAVKGYVIQPIDPEEPLRRLEEMSDEDLDKMFREGLSGVKKGQQDGSLPATDEIKQHMLSGMQDAVRNFSELSPAERREHVQRGAALIQRFAAITQRLAPDTQQQLRSQVQPFLGVIVAGYVAMPTQQRAELAPLINALKSFGW